MKPIDPYQPSRFVHPDDEDLPKDEQTTWLLRAPTVRESAFLQDAMADVRSTFGDKDEDGDAAPTGTAEMNMGRWNLLTLRFGLMEPENFGGWKTEVHPLDRDLPPVPTHDFLSTIPPHVREDLVSEIRKLGKVTVEEGKPSAPSSTSRSTRASSRNAGRPAKSARTA